MNFNGISKDSSKGCFQDGGQVLSSNFKMDGIASFACCGGVTSPPSFRQNQDGALLNPKTGLFAIADGADRYPGSAFKVLRAFNAKISELLEGILQNYRYPLSQDQLPFIKKSIIQAANTVAEQLEGNVSSTFTGLQILNTSTEQYGILLHAGDSCLWEYNQLTKQIKKLTKNNFWMLGKAKQLYQTEMLKINSNSLFVFVTDGITILDLAENSKQDRLRVKEIIDHPLSKIPERLIKAQSSIGQIMDDASCLILLPKNCNV
mgnify:FL=1